MNDVFLLLSFSTSVKVMHYRDELYIFPSGINTCKFFLPDSLARHLLFERFVNLNFGGTKHFALRDL